MMWKGLLLGWLGCENVHFLFAVIFHAVGMFLYCLSALESPDIGVGLCGWIIVGLSILLMLATLPISIWMCIKVRSLPIHLHKLDGL